MVTLSDINAVFTDIVADHKLLKAFYTYQLDDLDIDKITIDKYPLLFAQCTRISATESDETFTYEILVGDLVIEEQQFLDIMQVYSETHLILKDVLAAFNLAASTSGQYVPPKWVLDFPVTLTPFTARFNNMLTGWSATVDIRVPNPLNLCDALY